MLMLPSVRADIISSEIFELNEFASSHVVPESSQADTVAFFQADALITGDDVLGTDPDALGTDPLAGLSAKTLAWSRANSEDVESTGVQELGSHTIPPLPSSAGLYLSAMLSVGAWQLVRSTRSWQFGDLPDWYHAGGPLQIGHSVPVDLEAGFRIIVSFACDIVTRQDEFSLAALRCLPEEARINIESQWFHSADVRGPPCHS